MPCSFAMIASSAEHLLDAIDSDFQPFLRFLVDKMCIRQIGLISKTPKCKSLT